MRYQMDKDLIMTRCRKVYTALQNNSIFGYGDTPGEFEAINVFRKEDNAENVVKARLKENPMWDKPEKAQVKHKVASFYMVPASLIEK